MLYNRSETVQRTVEASLFVKYTSSIPAIDTDKPMMVSHLILTVNTEIFMMCSISSFLPVYLKVNCLLSFFVLSVGIFVAAHDMKSEWVVVKGVSHFAGDSRRQLWETFACVMAASVVSNILCDPYVFEQWSHYGGM